MRLWLAIRVFFAALSSVEVAKRLRAALDSDGSGSDTPQAAKAKPVPVESKGVTEPKRRHRSEAITLLATLQREARFVDLVQESLDQYSDEQVGAAARDVLRDSHNVLNRLFDLQAVLHQAEGSEVQVPEGFDPGEFRLSGNVTGQPPFHGRLVHHGWTAAKCELPEWSGSNQASSIVSAAEVELREI